MSPTPRTRSRRFSIGELICLRILLRNAADALAEAHDAKTPTLTKDAVRAAQIHLKTALELTKDAATL